MYDSENDFLVKVEKLEIPFTYIISIMLAVTKLQKEQFLGRFIQIGAYWDYSYSFPCEEEQIKFFLGDFGLDENSFASFVNIGHEFSLAHSYAYNANTIKGSKHLSYIAADMAEYINMTVNNSVYFHNKELGVSILSYEEDIKLKQLLTDNHQCISKDTALNQLKDFFDAGNISRLDFALALQNQLEGMEFEDELIKRPELTPEQKKLNEDLRKYIKEKEKYSEKNLLAEIARLNSGFDKNRLLFLAILQNQITFVKKLLTLGANPNFKISINGSPARSMLLYAAINGNTQIIYYLIKKGAVVNENKYESVTPLHMAIFQVQLAAVKILIESGADINACMSKCDNWTGLHLAADSGNIKIVEYLIDKGADKNAKTTDGKTPLHLAAENGHLEVVKKLIIGTNINAITKDGYTALTLAVKSGHFAIVEFMLKNGCDLKSKTHDECSLLHIAASYDRLEIL